jgi:SAM-dependent methyltransferase
MDRKYWEKIAPDYNEEIFDVLANDKKEIIRAAIRRNASLSKTVLDIGCAVGKWLPLLSPVFKKVIAVDISKKNLLIARAKHAGYDNIEYRRADMSSPGTKLPKADTAVCINAILTDSSKKRIFFFQNLSSCIKRGGHLILVVPSLESWLLARMVQQQWQIDKGLFREKLSGKEAIKKYRNMIQGNMDIDGVPTKHYLREELRLLLSGQKFEVTESRKIEYPWTTEFIDPPQWLKDPYPWDWMFVAQKK